MRSDLLATNPLPSLNRVYSTMIEEERMITITRAKEERGEVMGLAMQTSGRGVRGRGDAKEKAATRTYCSLTGHEAGNYFQLIGYPDWWGERPKIEGKGNGRGKTQQLTRTGLGRGGVVRANAVKNGGTSSGNTILEGDNSSLVGLSS